MTMAEVIIRSGGTATISLDVEKSAEVGLPGEKLAPITVETGKTVEITLDTPHSGGIEMEATGGNIDRETYAGPYTVTPKAHEEQILDTASKVMARDVTVKKVPYYETSNVSGNTVYIASGV